MKKSKSRIDSWKEILKIAWPLIIANSFWNLQLTIDRVFLGAHSTEALGAAMAVMGVFWTPMALLQQTSNYITTFVAQYYGAKDIKMIGPAVWQSIYVSLIGGVLFLLLIFFSESLFTFIGHSETMLPLEVKYFNAICFSALPTALVAAFSGFYTGLGLTKMVMWINAVGVIINIVFDYLLIFGNFGFPAMGITGAGYATAIANCGGAIFGFFMIFKSRYEKQYELWKGWRWNSDLMKRFLKFGIPSGLQWALEGLAFTVFLIVIGRFPNGNAALAGSSIAVTVMMLSVLPAMGVAQAVMVLVGQHLGEKKPQLAESVTWSGAQVAAIYMAIVGLTFLLFPNFYLGWFENKQNLNLWAEVQQMVPYLLMFVALFTMFDSLNFSFSFALKGAGDTKFVSLVALLLPWPMMVAPTIIMKDWIGAIYWAWAAASVYIMSLAGVYWLRFKGGKWKQMSVIN